MAISVLRTLHTKISNCRDSFITPQILTFMTENMIIIWPMLTLPFVTSELFLFHFIKAELELLPSPAVCVGTQHSSNLPSSTPNSPGNGHRQSQSLDLEAQCH